MAAINFPSNPAGQTPVNTFSPTSTPSSTSNGTTYTYDGTKWVGSSSGGGGGGSQDLQSVTDEGNTTTNGATFGGDITIEQTAGNPHKLSARGGAKQDLSIEPSDDLYINCPTVNLHHDSDSNPTIRLRGSDGSATFAGSVTSVPSIGSAFYAYNGGTSSDNAILISNTSDGSGITTILGYDGSATFAGDVIIGPNQSGSISNNQDGVQLKNYGFGLFLHDNANNGAFISCSQTGQTSDLFSVSGNGSVTAAGSATFGGVTGVRSETFPSGNAAEIYPNGLIRITNPSTSGPVSVFEIYSSDVFSPGGLKVDMFSDGSATFVGTVTSANSFAIQLEADDDTKYTSTTDADGVVTRVYNGAVLDVKERIQNVLARMDAIEANEVTDDATDSALLTLVANLSSRLDERDASILELQNQVQTLLNGGN